MRRTASILLLVALFGSSAGAQREGQRRLLAPESPEGLAMLLSPGRARIELDNGRSGSISLRKHERLTSIVESNRGWIASGARATRSGMELIILREGGRRTARIKPPRSTGAMIRLRPTPLIEDGRLVGLIWLEGETLRSLSVRATQWSGSAWETTSHVSKPGPGSQTGLTGIVLDDGRWLLVWSAFDGMDDELTYALRNLDGTWSRPRPLTAYAAPDVTPSLIRSGNGALLAWNQMADHGSQVMLASFEDSSWHARASNAPSQSIRPQLLRRGESTLLLYRQAWPVVWSVAELDSAGRQLHVAVSESTSETRPAPIPMGDSGVILKWRGDPSETILPWELLPREVSR